MTDKQSAIEGMEVILSLSERVVAIAQANIAKAKAAEGAQRQIVDSERTKE